MSRRRSTGSDTALVKAMVVWGKACAGRGSTGRREAYACLAHVRKLRSEQSGLAAIVTRYPNHAERIPHLVAHYRAEAKASARLARRVRKKLGQPYRKNMNRKAMRRRASGKNEVQP